MHYIDRNIFLPPIEKDSLFYNFMVATEGAPDTYLPFQKHIQSDFQLSITPDGRK
jgi:hypothetical protein